MPCASTARRSGSPSSTAPPKLAFFDCAGVRLLLDVPEDKEFDHPGSILYFAVDDIRQSHQLLAPRGVRFRQEPHLIARLPDWEVWMAFFDDTGGEYARADVGARKGARLRAAFVGDVKIADRDEHDVLAAGDRWVGVKPLRRGDAGTHSPLDSNRTAADTPLDF